MSIGGISIGKAAIGKGPSTPIEGIITNTIPSFSQNGTGGILAVDSIIANVTSSVTFRQNATTVKSSDTITSVIQNQIPSFSQNVNGLVSLDSIVANVTTVLVKFSQNITSIKSSDNIQGLANSSLPKFNQNNIVVISNDEIVTTITNLLPSFSQNVIAFYDDSPQPIIGVSTTSLNTFSTNLTADLLIDNIDTNIVNNFGLFRQTVTVKAVTPHYAEVISIIPKFNNVTNVEIKKIGLYDVCFYLNVNTIGNTGINCTSFTNIDTIGGINDVTTKDFILNKNTKAEINQCHQ